MKVIKTPRHLLSIADLTPWDLNRIIELAQYLKRRYYSGERVLNVLKGYTIALLFEKPSTRTRVSMELAAVQLGMYPIVLTWSETQLGRGEPIKDTARVLSRYVDLIAARVYRHENLLELARYSSVPVVNMLSDKEHPLQAIADMLTILEVKGRLKGLKLVFVGDGRSNVAHSLIIAAAMLGINMVVASPPQLSPDKDVLDKAYEFANASGARIEVVDDPQKAVEEADVVYTDVWVSMGEEEIAEKKRQLLQGYTVTKDLLARAKHDVVFMHCLPARRGEEVTDEVIEGPQSIVWLQAENRLHAQKAVLLWLLQPKIP
ncbi:MAG TPA: ornithine carbamoyltransferase [Pyrodictium sp.]|nr:ornithine carbamoyltransferase [Pyrodictium sp.]